MGDEVHPSYDIWRFGCLLAEALAKGKPRFARVLRWFVHLQPEDDHIDEYDLVVAFATQQVRQVDAFCMLALSATSHGTALIDSSFDRLQGGFAHMCQSYNSLPAKASVFLA